VEAVTPAISILKQVSSSPTGPWASTVNVSPGGNVYYRLTIENIGDVALSPVSVTDPTLDISSCVWPSTLPVGTATVDPTASCIVGPKVASSTIGSFPNTATAHGTYSGTVYDSAPSTATYVTSSLTLVKNLTSVNGSGATTSFSAAGDVLAYSYTITNTGTSSLDLSLYPVTVTDSNTTVSCPATDTSGNHDGMLAAGENIVCTASYTVTAFDMSVGSVTNTASAAIGATTSNTDRETVYRNQPDLVISKTNNSGGYVYKGVSFNWTLIVSNNGPQTATFTNGQTIFSDQLPATGATYGSPVAGSFTLITNSANISCSINGSKLLTCTASGADVTIGATTGSFAVTVPVTPTVVGSLINSSAVVDPNSNITESNEGNNTGSDSVNVSELSAPTISKSFSPATINSGGSSTITFTLSNPNANVLTNASFSDSLSNMAADGDQSVLGTCSGANSNSLLDGDTSLSLSGITIPANSSCTVTVIVTSSTLGVNPNITSGVTTAQTAIGAASNTANLTVLGPATIAKAFSPATIVTGETSTITFTLANPNASILAGASFSDTLSNMSISGAQNAGGTCTGAGSNSFANAATALTFSGISIPASSSCTVTVVVTSTTLGVNPNTTSGVTTTQTTIGTASNTANLTVTAPDLRLQKTNASATVIAGGTVSYTLTVKNVGDAATTGTITVVDVLPTDVTLPVSTSSPFTPGGTNGANWSCTWSGQVITCTSGTAISATTGQSVFSFTADVDSGATGNLVNQAKVGGGGDPTNPNAPTSGETQSCTGDNTPEGCATHTDTVSLEPDLSLAKDDGTTVLTAGGITTYAMTVTNNGVSATSGKITVVDVLPAGLTMHAGTLSPFTPTGTNGANWSCAWSLQVISCESIASIPAAGGTSTFNVVVDVDADATGTLTNKAQVGGGGDTSTPNPPTETTVTTCTGTNLPDEGCATDSDVVLTAPSISKSFSPDPISVGGISTLTFTITNANTGTALSGVAFTDTLPAGLQVAATPNSGTTGCGAPTFSPSAGATSLTFSGGTIAASGTCTVSVDVTATTTGTKNNTSGAVSSTNGGTGNTASDSLTVNSLSAPSIAKSFDAATIPLNDSTALNFTISNPTANTVSLTGISFTDNLPSGLVISTPNGLTGSCGGGTITATAGATSVSLSGATLAANASCTFKVNVTGNTAGVKNNSVTVSSTNGGTGNTSNANVTVVSPPSISKSFSPASISIGGLSTLTFTITNPNTGASLTGVAFTDSLPSGLQVAGTPNTSTSGCGAPTFAPSAGSTSLTFSNGTIAASGTCTISVDVTATTAGIKNNTSGTVSSTNGGTGNTASDTLTVADDVDLALDKDVNTPSPKQGDNVVFTITVTNQSTTTDATNVEITDVLPAGLTFVSANPSLGTYTAPKWTIATLAANTSETLQLTVTVDQIGSITNFAQITKSDQTDPDSTPNNNTTQTPAEDDEASATIGGLFDPPTAIKTFNVVSGIPELEFRMVWINSGNTLAINTQVTDTIPTGTTYVSGPICTPQGSSTTTTCSYNSGTNSIFWQGSIGPDNGNLTEGTAANEVVITFRVTVNDGVNQVLNTASSVTDLDGNESFTNDDPIVSVVDSNQVVWNRNTPGTSSLPSTGFAPAVTTILPKQPAESAYLATDLWLEIPKLKVKMPIVGVPFKDGKWDVTWLDKNAGWLNGTAFPSWDGNSVLTGHVGLANGNPGPFANLGGLAYGDQVIIHVSGQKYIYEVRTSRLVSPSSVSSVIKHEELPWITLITCKSYNEKTGEYTYRTVVRAVLVKVLDE
jgi:LPXTG-site transpeptidase (sortase) family protein